MLVKITVSSEAVAIRAFVAACSAGWFANQPHPGPLWARLFATASPPLDASASTLRSVLDTASDLASIVGGVAVGESYDGGLSHATCCGTSLRVDGCELTIAGGAESVTRKVAAALSVIASLGEDEDEGEPEGEGEDDEYDGAIERRFLPESEEDEGSYLATRYGGTGEDEDADADLREADTTAPWERW